MSRVLVVDDDQASARTLQLHLRAEGHDTVIAHDAEAGLAAATELAPELVILDIRMPGRSGLEVLPEFKALQPAPHVIMITAFHDMDIGVNMSTEDDLRLITAEGYLAEANNLSVFICREFGQA